MSEIKTAKDTTIIVRKDGAREEKRYHLPDKMVRAVQVLLENETEIARSTNNIPFEDWNRTEIR